VSKVFGKFRNFDYEEDFDFLPRKKKKNEQRSLKKKSNYEDYDYFQGYEDYQKPARKKARHIN
jgi:hypothetical protein